MHDNMANSVACCSVCNTCRAQRKCVCQFPLPELCDTKKCMEDHRNTFQNEHHLSIPINIAECFSRQSYRRLSKRVALLKDTSKLFEENLSHLDVIAEKIEVSFQRELSILTALKNEYIAKVKQLKAAATEEFKQALTEIEQNIANSAYAPENDISKWLWAMLDKDEFDDAPLFQGEVRVTHEEDKGQQFALKMNSVFQSLTAWHQEFPEDTRMKLREELQSLKMTLLVLEQKNEAMKSVILDLREGLKTTKNICESSEAKVESGMNKIESQLGLKIATEGIERGTNRPKTQGPTAETKAVFEERKVLGGKRIKDPTRVDLRSPEATFGKKPHVVRHKPIETKSSKPQDRVTSPEQPESMDSPIANPTFITEDHAGKEKFENEKQKELQETEARGVHLSPGYQSTYEREQMEENEMLRSSERTRSHPMIQCKACSSSFKPEDTDIHCNNFCLCKNCLTEDMLAHKRHRCMYCEESFSEKVATTVHDYAKQCHVCGIALPLEEFPVNARCNVCLFCIEVSGMSAKCVGCEASSFNITAAEVEKIGTKGKEFACCGKALGPLRHSTSPCGHKICKVHAANLVNCRVCKKPINNKETFRAYS